MHSMVLNKEYLSMKDKEKAKLFSQYQLQTRINLPTFQLDTLVFLRATMKLVS